MQSEPKFIVVVGTSAGGINALSELVAQLTPDMDAAFFIVMHLSRKGITNFLVHQLQRFTSLPCMSGSQNEPIKKGTVYVATPDEHMLLAEGKIILGKGPAENRWRPSINNLFRSAASVYSSRVIGIILTGYLDDGTQGMAAIRRSGGVCIVQDPNEAEYPDMPLSVLNIMEVDYCVPLSGMGNIIEDITQKPEPQKSDVPPDILAEADIDRRVSTSIAGLTLFEKSIYNCPDCGGGLWITQKDYPTHYRCHVGHSYSEKDLLIRQNEAIENTLWMAMRLMEERKSLLTRLYENENKKGLKNSARLHSEQANELNNHIDNLKKILFTQPSAD